MLKLVNIGALTLKTTPFVLRSWSLQSHNSIDPTDPFGQATLVYLNKNQVIKIEPQFSNDAPHSWLTDKGRHFFDSLFEDSSENKSFTVPKPLITSVVSTLYAFNICNFKQALKSFFLILFENVSNEILGLLSVISQTNSFIKIRRVENSKVNTSIETNFQINSLTSSKKLEFSSLCLLVSTNSRYEGSCLNLKLRQRYLKGAFKVLSVGSVLDLTFPTTYVGSTLSALKSLLEGSTLFCKDILNSDNPLLVTNTQSFRHTTSQALLLTFKVLNYSNLLNKVWNGVHVLNSSLHETGLYVITAFPYFSLKDMKSSCALYLVNVNLSTVANFKKIIGSRLLTQNKTYNEVLFTHHNFKSQQAHLPEFVSFKKLVYFPTNTFFENRATFINTEGRIKKTEQLVLTHEAKNDWQLLRKFSQTTQAGLHLNCFKDNKILSCGTTTSHDFQNFQNFHTNASQNLTSLNIYFNSGSRKFFIFKNFFQFKAVAVKLYKTKLKYWLDDFYLGGKDTFCHNSLTLIRCSINHRLQFTNFFCTANNNFIEHIQKN